MSTLSQQLLDKMTWRCIGPPRGGPRGRRGR